MKLAPIPENEKERLAALYEYSLLDTLPESDYDNITRIASEICQVPISLITLLDHDRQFFKSRVGLHAPQTPRDVSFCGHAIMTPNEIFIVRDSSKDERFHDNPLFTGDPHVGFYAGVPLVNENGFPFGTLCVIDNKPNDLTQEQKETLQALAKQTVTQFELRKLNLKLQKQRAELQDINEELERFAYVAAHDLKSPCNNLIMLSGLLKDGYGKYMDADGLFMLEGLNSASTSLAGLIDGILKHTKAIHETDTTKEIFTFASIAEELKRVIGIPQGFTFTYDNGALEIFTLKQVLIQVLLNLCVNAIKYNDKEHGCLHISAIDKGDCYQFSVTDNGPGIPSSQFDKIFELFTTLGTDGQGNKGNGIGLSTVKRLVEKHGGTIAIESEAGKGSSFIFTTRK